LLLNSRCFNFQLAEIAIALNSRCFKEQLLERAAATKKELKITVAFK
jgi:hypothetical protein